MGWDGIEVKNGAGFMFERMIAGDGEGRGETRRGTRDSDVSAIKLARQAMLVMSVLEVDEFELSRALRQAEAFWPPGLRQGREADDTCAPARSCGRKVTFGKRESSRRNCAPRTPITESLRGQSKYWP
nr:hypothetical protein CFP56_16651 [Quercus suber]